ncbi:maleylpyruvate isomerase family mycothiol-dependent enzyme [Micrococcales bacterium 31B]|nr:maleylpyruvate isomerase family mycothiol-dependent enzyme [Micrococcales bacterium 31B]
MPESAVPTTTQAFGVVGAGLIPDTDPTPSDILRDVAGAQGQFLAVLDQVGEAGYRAESPLPGWTIAHVVAHLTVVGEAQLEQVQLAAEGTQKPFFDGRTSVRDGLMEQAQVADFAAAKARFEAVCEALNEAWPVGTGWDAPVAFRQGTVRDCLLAWWRETRIHTFDLGLPFDDGQWSPHFHAHLWEFLRVCLPDDGTPVKLRGQRPTVERTWGDATSADDYIRISGSALDLSLWLGGRTPNDWPLATRAGSPVPLPELGPWPGALK